MFHSHQYRAELPEESHKLPEERGREKGRQRGEGEEDREKEVRAISLQVGKVKKGFAAEIEFGKSKTLVVTALLTNSSKGSSCSNTQGTQPQTQARIQFIFITTLRDRFQVSHSLNHNSGFQKARGNCFFLSTVLKFIWQQFLS